jgi:CYTH domain-containing protein
MAVSLKYAVIERERRFLIRSMPSGVRGVSEIRDRYIERTRLRLREVRGEDGRVVRKLGQKVRLGDGPAAIACTSMYLDDDEWLLLSGLPAWVLTKRRHRVERDGVRVVIDEFEDGTLLAEIDDGELPPKPAPAWLDVVDDVTADELWTGASLAERGAQPPKR